LLKLTAQVLFLCSLAMMGTPSNAQADRTITIRMLDSKTGNPIPPSMFQVTINTKDYSHLESFPPNKEGLGELVVKGDATVISVQALYQPGDRIFVDCDLVKDKIAFQSHWYAIPEIFASGIVAPNSCSKLKAVARPGEFVFFVRPMNWYEKLKE
jgi:hypothetical protein